MDYLDLVDALKKLDALMKEWNRLCNRTLEHLKEAQSEVEALRDCIKPETLDNKEA